MLITKNIWLRVVMQPLRHSSRPGCRPAFHSGDNSISARTKTKKRSAGRRPASSVRNLRGGGGGPPRAPNQIYSARGIERNTIILASGGPGAVPSTEKPPAARNPHAAADPGLMNNPCGLNGTGDHF
jgi:hypothetical protein